MVQACVALLCEKSSNVGISLSNKCRAFLIQEIEGFMGPETDSPGAK